MSEKPGHLYKDHSGNYLVIVDSIHCPELGKELHLVMNKGGHKVLMSQEQLERNYIQEVINKASKIP